MADFHARFMVDWGNDNTFTHPLSDITHLVMRANWDIGVTDFNEGYPMDGSANITVFNNNGQFYLGMDELKPMRRVRIEILNPTTAAWVTMWTGFTDNFEFPVGLVHGDTMQIIANQNMQNLFLVEREVGVLENVRADEVINYVMGGGYWLPPAIVQAGRADICRLNQDAYLYGAEIVAPSLDEGIYTYKYVGADWDVTRPQGFFDTLKNVLRSDRGFMYLDREGFIQFKNNQTLIADNDIDVYWQVHIDVYDADLDYGKNVINQVRLGYEVYTVEPDVELWVLPEAIDMGPLSTHDLTIVLDDGGAKPRPRAVIEPDMVATRSSMEFTPELPVTQSGIAYVRQVGNSHVLRIFNNADYPVSLDTLKFFGSELVSEGTEERVQDDASIMDLRQTRLSQFQSSVITEPQQATLWVRQELSEGLPIKYEYTDLHIREGRGNLSKILATTVGSNVCVVDPLKGVANDSNRHVVLQESYNFTPNYLEVDYKLHRFDTFGGSYLDVNAYLNTEAYLS